MNTLDNLLLDYKNDMPEVDLDRLPTKSDYNESKSYNSGPLAYSSDSSYVTGTGTMQMAFDGHLPNGLMGLLPKGIPTISPGSCAFSSFTNNTAFLRQSIDAPLPGTRDFVIQANNDNRERRQVALDSMMSNIADNIAQESRLKEQQKQDNIQIASHISVHRPLENGDYWLNTGISTQGKKPQLRIDSYTGWG
jgi:hypothetical protein